MFFRLKNPMKLFLILCEAVIPMAIPMSPRSRNSMKLFSIMVDACMKQKSKMATHKQDISMFVSRHLGFCLWSNGMVKT